MKRKPVGLVHDGGRLARRVFAAGVEVFSDAAYHHQLSDRSDPVRCPISHRRAADIDIEHEGLPSMRYQFEHAHPDNTPLSPS